MVTVMTSEMVLSSRCSRRLQKSKSSDDDFSSTRDGSARGADQVEHDSDDIQPKKLSVAMTSAVLELPAVSMSETHETVETGSTCFVQPAEKEMPSPGLSPIQSEAKEANRLSSSTVLAPQGLVALPIVTKSTRRETFASAKAPMKKERKEPSTTHTSPLSSTSSSGDDENIMDLFAPPQSSRSRSRPSSTPTTDPPAYNDIVKARAQAKSRMKQAQTLSSPLPPSSKGKSRSSPKTPHNKKTGGVVTERNAMSTTNKKQCVGGTLVHIPRQSPGDSNFDPFSTFHKSPPWEIDVMQKATESAPARMPVSFLSSSKRGCALLHFYNLLKVFLRQSVLSNCPLSLLTLFAFHLFHRFHGIQFQCQSLALKRTTPLMLISLMSHLTKKWPCSSHSKKVLTSNLLAFEGPHLTRCQERQWLIHNNNSKQDTTSSIIIKVLQ